MVKEQRVALSIFKYIGARFDLVLTTFKVFVLVSTTVSLDRLVGLVVKASASRAQDPGFESRLRREFFGVESYQ